MCCIDFTYIKHLYNVIEVFININSLAFTEHLRGPQTYAMSCQSLPSGLFSGKCYQCE